MGTTQLRVIKVENVKSILKEIKTFDNWDILPKIIERSRIVVKMATPRNMRKRSCPMRWKSSADSWSETRIAGKTKPKAMPSWLPNTPMDVAVLIWCGGNHVAANWAGMPRMKIWEAATTVWPLKVIHHCSGPVPATLIQEPRQVPADPSNTPHRSPWQVNSSQTNMNVNSQLNVSVNKFYNIFN